VAGTKRTLFDAFGIWNAIFAMLAGTSCIQDGATCIQDGATSVQDEAFSIQDGASWIQDVTTSIQNGTTSVQDGESGAVEGAGHMRVVLPLMVFRTNASTFPTQID
jgi:hypothetical protein